MSLYNKTISVSKELHKKLTEEAKKKGLSIKKLLDKKLNELDNRLNRKNT